MSEWTKDRETCERVARVLAGNAVCDFDRLSDWARERYLSDAQAVLASLEAERDAAYKKGFATAKRDCLEAVESFSDNDLTENGPYFLAVDVLKAIRAVEPKEKP